uniref:Carboxypeptidase n=1 Tax=Salix viminalis TaxID=40686 RepID=A0A6N2N618_SALVM
MQEMKKMKKQTGYLHFLASPTSLFNNSPAMLPLTKLLVELSFTGSLRLSTTPCLNPWLYGSMEVPVALLWHMALPEEIGPFRINKTASGLYLNKFSWNSVANLLFLETPAGVGFSYSNRSSDLFDTGDIRTATDSLEFLVGWMNRFPRYKNREVYLTGESYAGHYVPQLARAIIMYNKRSKHPINLKGFMVGNAVTDNYYDNLGTVTYWWSHAMISDKTYQQLVNTCDFRRQKESDECESLYSYAMDQEFGNIDQYNIYSPPCNNSDGSTSTRHSIRLPHHPHKVFRKLSGYDPCTEKHAEIYYNRPDVQKELHANVTKIPYKWTACSEVLNRNWNDTDVSVLPIYREMLASGLRIWVFSYSY